MVKLSDYIVYEYEKSSSALSSDDINGWIIQWYVKEFSKAPPMWLAVWRKDGNKKK